MKKKKKSLCSQCECFSSSSFSVGLKIYNAIFEPITLMDPWMLDRVSHSYYIDANKTVYLIYQPYELAPYAQGNTYIKITQEDAKNLK